MSGVCSHLELLFFSCCCAEASASGYARVRCGPAQLHSAMKQFRYDPFPAMVQRCPATLLVADCAAADSAALAASLCQGGGAGELDSPGGCCRTL